MKDLLTATAERAARYRNGWESRAVAPPPEAIDRLAELDKPLPDEPADPETVLSLLDEIGSPATVASAGRRYFGFVVGGVLPAALAANWFAGAWDQNAGMHILSPAAAALEQIAIRWLRELFSLPPTAGGGFTTGATMANFTALAAARHAILKKHDWDVESRGLFGAPPITVVVGDEVHVSVLKALSLLGLGRERVIRVPVDEQGRMRADTLPDISGATIICIQSGNVNSGAFDPALEICAAARETGAWVHVDGAFGLWAAAAPERARLTAGVNQADSWATDAHKWLNVPQDSGIVICRRAEYLWAAMSTSAAYLVGDERPEPHHSVPEMSRRARGIEIWAALRSLGKSGLADLIERTCRHASRFASGLREAGYQILNDVVLNQVLVSFGDAEKTNRIIEGIQTEGTCWCGGTVWQDHTAMRISVSSWATTDADVERSLDAILRVASQQT
ncbi:MAG: aspartate aminotransferase family protein [Deltaproteobacteria bacterium]|nr:MAG: aspartate aminotransferase family protein [Deltaproteobacteria bacterium]